MSNVFSMERPQAYWISRAEKHRLAGRYDEAMALLSRAKDQFGTNESIELELARTYEAMDCEEEAARAYLRVVRLSGRYTAQALFHLALSSAQRADLRRAVSYFERFECTDRSQVPPELAAMLGEQLQEELGRDAAATRRERARALERRAVERLQDGKVYAARRTLDHALAFGRTAQRLTLFSCCCLLQEDFPGAVEAAQEAHRLSPARVQTMCVLTDALHAAGERKEARRMLYLSALRAGSADEMLSVAVESAKLGEDALTLRLTRSVLRREPFCTRAMTMRACALMNTGQLQEAARLFGRLCGLLPEDTVCQAYFRMARDGERPQERLSLGTDVPRQEAMSRVMQMISALYEDARQLREDAQAQRTLCRLSAWAFRSAVAGQHASALALILMSRMNTQASREVLLDALTDPQIGDGVKSSILQALTARDGFRPYDADMGGRLLRLAAGGSVQRKAAGETAQRVVQAAADALMPSFPTAPEVLLPLYIAYLDAYGLPQRRERAACAAALEAAFHTFSGRTVNAEVIAAKNGASPRLCRVILRRLERVREQMGREGAQDERAQNHTNTGENQEAQDEVH